MKAKMLVIEGESWRWHRGAGRGKVHLFRNAFKAADGSWKPTSFCGCAHGGDSGVVGDPNGPYEFDDTNLCGKCLDALDRKGYQQ